MPNDIEFNKVSSVHPISREDSLPILETATPTGKALAEIFSRDSLASPLKSSREETQMPSFWKKMMNYFIQTEEKPSLTPVTTVNAENSTQIEPISRIPILDEPESIQHRQVDSTLLEPMHLAPNVEAKISNLVDSIEKMVEALCQGHSPEDSEVMQSATEVISTVDRLIQDDLLTIEQIMHAVTKLVIERQEVSGIVATELYKKMQELSRSSLEKFQKLDDKAQKDINVSDAFSKAHWAIAAATGLCAIVFAATFFFPAIAVAAPIAAAIPVLKIANIGLSIGTALTKAGEGYFKYSSNQNKAGATERENQREIFRDASTNQNEQMMRSLEAVQEAQGNQIKLAHKHKQLIDLVMQR